MSAEPRLRTEFWVKAQVRTCDVQAIPAYIRRRGDADAGTVVLLISDLKGGVLAYSAAYGPDGERGWIAANAGAPMTDAEAGDYMRRQADIDPDLWVIEIEDPEQRYVLDGPRLD
ncbi:MAG: DUF1491 family protein [Rhodospirillales bacterium]